MGGESDRFGALHGALGIEWIAEDPRAVFRVNRVGVAPPKASICRPTSAFSSCQALNPPKINYARKQLLDKNYNSAASLKQSMNHTK